MTLRQTPEQMNTDMRDLMKSPFGQRFLLTVLNQAGVNATTHTGDARDSAFAEGRRSMGLDLISRMKAADFPGFLKILALEQEMTSD